MKSLGRVAIVTGAGSGVGRAYALALLANGYSVALAGRRIETLQASLAEAEEHRERAIAVATDAGSPESVAELFARTRPPANPKYRFRHRKRYHRCNRRKVGPLTPECAARHRAGGTRQARTPQTGFSISQSSQNRGLGDTTPERKQGMWKQHTSDRNSTPAPDRAIQ